MSKHWKHHATDEGLDDSDILAIASDEASEIRSGRLVNGICQNCNQNFQQVIGVTRCWWCKEGY